MATPQQRPDPERQDPIRRPADLRAVEGRGTRSLGGGAGWFAWWWVWLLVILCAIWFAGWGWGGYGGWWWGNRGGTYGSGAGVIGNGAAGGGATGGAARMGAGAANAGGAPTGTDANMNIVTGSGAVVLASIDKQTYIGKPFQVNDAVVTRKVNDHVLWIGENNSSGNSASMLVVLQGAGNNSANGHLAQGDLVNVTGTVEKAPPAAQARNNWKLNGNGQQRLEQQGAYVAASQVQRESNGKNG